MIEVVEAPGSQGLALCIFVDDESAPVFRRVLAPVILGDAVLAMFGSLLQVSLAFRRVSIELVVDADTQNLVPPGLFRADQLADNTFDAGNIEVSIDGNIEIGFIDRFGCSGLA